MKNRREWLPAVEGWCYIPIKHVAIHVGRGEAPTYADQGLAVINQACIHWDGLHLENAKFHDPAVPFSRKARVEL
jgi:hypothetical protein